jgi:hypothetical protein
MGRYYWGDIEGKFWSCQSSFDVENICSIDCNETFYLYLGCGCTFTTEPELYCAKCFKNIEEHRQLCIEEGYIEEDDVSEKLWVINESIFEYEIELEDLHEIQETIENLNDIIGQYIEVLTFKKKDKGYEYDFELTYAYKNLESDVKKQKDELIARYCLARQIELCLLKKGECLMICEC